MISDWLLYIKNMLAISLRRDRLIQLAYVLISPAEQAFNDMSDYINRARLYASCTGQVCWLEYLLRTELGDSSITIEESDGQPYDFTVNSDNYIDENLVYGLVNRFKLAGKSFEINFSAVSYNIQWGDPLCEQTTPDSSISWVEPYCELEHGELQVVDINRDLVNSLFFDRTGQIYPADLSPHSVEYAGESVTVTKISGGDYCTITMEEEVPQKPKSRDLTITCGIQYPGYTERSWVFRFESGSETFDLTITQEAGEQP